MYRCPRVYLFPPPMVDSPPPVCVRWVLGQGLGGLDWDMGVICRLSFGLAQPPKYVAAPPSIATGGWRLEGRRLQAGGPELLEARRLPEDAGGRQ